MNRLHNQEPMSVLFPCNLILWRQVSFMSSNRGDFTTVEPTSCPFVKSDRGSWMAKVTLTGSFIWEPEVIPYAIRNRTCHGITLFIKEQPAPDWTHLYVTGISKSMATQPHGGAIFARIPTEPILAKDYIKFRLRTFEHVRQNLNCGFDRKVEMAQKVQAGLAVGTRLITGGIWNDPKYRLQYEVISEHAVSIPSVPQAV